MEAFNIEHWKEEKSAEHRQDFEGFRQLCTKMSEAFEKEWEETSDREGLLTIQKRAILGYEDAATYFKSKIDQEISNSKDKNLMYIDYPGYYRNLTEAVFHEVWGLAGLAEWFDPAYAESSSAKIIGSRIYFMHEGHMKLMPQKIGKERREQLLRAFLLADGKARPGEDYYEVYMVDGTRVTIFRNNIVKNDEDFIVLRRYTFKDYSFENMAACGTIPRDMIYQLKELVAEGPNCAFVGEIRSGKTTFLSTYQSYEDRTLEGVLVETDPEIPIHKIMPEAPIVQIVADGERMENMVKSLMRSDADYFIFGEARDGIAFNTALRVAERGGSRMKITAHITDPFDFPFAVANEVAISYGGDVNMHAVRAASAFDYIFHFGQLEDRSQKRLLGLYEMSCDRAMGRITIKCLWKYDKYCDSWTKPKGSAEKKEYYLSGQNNAGAAS